MSGQQPPQAPPNPQAVPDQRLEQMAERIRQMELQNTQLRTFIDTQARMQNPNAPVPPKRDPLFKPEVQDAITQLVNERLGETLKAERTRHEQQIGYLADQLDEAKFNLNYGGDKYKDLMTKVQALRQDYQARNQYIPREEALRIVHFEETKNKALTPAPPAKVAPEPVFDRYLQTWVNPETNQPQLPQTPEMTPTPPAQGWVPPQAPAQPPPVGMQQPGVQPPGAYNPYGQTTQPNMQNFGLPPQGLNPAAPAGPGQAAPARGPISLESADADLQAFEAKYGEIAL